jgi:hypothetical protein
MQINYSVMRLIQPIVLVVLAGCGGAQPGAAAPAQSASEPTPAENSGTPERGGDPAAKGAPETTSSGEAARAAPPDPYADMPHPAPTDTGRAQLEAGDVKATVEGYRPHLRKTCWEPRVNASGDGLATTRVAIEVEVSSDGSVKEVRAVGGKDYAGLSECVQAHVQRWQFPRAKQKSSLMFPIVFDRGEATYVQVK